MVFEGDGGGGGGGSPLWRQGRPVKNSRSPAARSARRLAQKKQQPRVQASPFSLSLGFLMTHVCFEADHCLSIRFIRFHLVHRGAVAQEAVRRAAFFAAREVLGVQAVVLHLPPDQAKQAR